MQQAQWYYAVPESSPLSSVLLRLVMQRSRVWVSGPAGIVGGEVNNQRSLPPTIPRLRWDPWARNQTPNCSPGAAALAVHCSGCVHGVCVFTAVCVHFGWVKGRAQIPSMGHHTWPHVTSLFISSLDSHSDGTHSLQMIHWWASDVMLHLSKCVQMKRQTYLPLS